MNRSCKAFLCQNELGLITVTMNVEGDNVFYDLLKYTKGQLHTVLRKKSSILGCSEQFLQGEFTVMYD